MNRILQIIGPPDTGKTTIADLLIHELVPSAVLVVDASGNQQLSHRLTLEQPRKTLRQLMEQFESQPIQTQEGVDWAFHDLVVSVGEDIDLLSLGALPGHLPETASEKLTYGLNRLMDNYDYVVIDGFHAALDTRIKNRELMRVVAVATPERYDLDFEALATVRTPVVILNRAPETSLPEPLNSDLDRAIEHGEVRLIGRLPDYPDPETRIREMPAVFHNILLRLDLPLSTERL